MKDNKFKLGQLKKDFDKLKQRLPQKIADESRSFFMRSFAQGGFNNTGLVEKWENTIKRKMGKSSKPILVRTGRLRNSVRIGQVSFGKSVLRSDVPYAKIHNEGGTFNVKSYTREAHEKKVRYGPASYNIKSRKIDSKSKKLGMMQQKVKAHKMTMPKRKFMGRSKALDTRVYRLIKKEIKGLFK